MNMIEEIKNLETIDIQELLNSSKSENYNLVSKLMSDYKSGINKFDKKGEILICCKENNRIIGICGLNIEPQSELKDTARVRRLYILPQFREKQIGKKIIQYLLNYAKSYFKEVTTNIGNLNINGFYINCGFKQVNDIPGITHKINLST